MPSYEFECTECAARQTYKTPVNQLEDLLVDMGHPDIGGNVNFPGCPEPGEACRGFGRQLFGPIQFKIN
jgi:hypothetical protein|tara:strand:+ start:479 stop:685 length:207 start_codon:yes stop_codon:yes gene_type:complete